MLDTGKGIMGNTWAQQADELKGRIHPRHPAERAAGGMGNNEVLSCWVGHGSGMTQDLPVSWTFLVGQLPVTAVTQPRERDGLV